MIRIYPVMICCKHNEIKMLDNFEIDRVDCCFHTAGFNTFLRVPQEIKEKKDEISNYFSKLHKFREELG